MLYNGILEAGFSVIEAGSFFSPKAVPQMADTDELFRRIKSAEHKVAEREARTLLIDGVEVRALVANLKGVERAVNCGCKKIKLNVSACMEHNMANLNRTPAETVTGFKECVDKAAENNVLVSGSIAMAFGSQWIKEIPAADISEIVDAYLAVGINEISLSDTSGMAYPLQVYELYKNMSESYPNVTWWLHFHDTRGMGLANVLAGMQAGATRFDVSFAGLGGCPFVPGASGNISSEDTVHMLNEMQINTGVDLGKVINIGKQAAQLAGREPDSRIQRAGASSGLHPA
jgi:hydroxymethylglutaryl-CoA lyase